MTLSAVRLGVPTHLAAPAGATVVYTVPSWHRAILRDARLGFTAGNATRTVNFGVLPAVGDPVMFFYSTNVGQGTVVALVDAFIVLEEGDEVFIDHSSGEAYVLLSGHEFTR